MSKKVASLPLYNLHRPQKSTKIIKTDNNGDTSLNNNPLLSLEIYYILSSNLVYPFLYAFILTAIAAGVLQIYNNVQNKLPDTTTEMVLNFWSLYVVWLLPFRASSAIGDGTSQAEVINTILIYSEKYIFEVTNGKKNEASDNDEIAIEGMTMLTHFIDLFSSKEPHLVDEPVILNNHKIMGETHLGYQILIELRTFHMRQQIALPRSLHSVCIVLVILFHAILFPLALYESNEWYTLIYTFGSAFVSTMCLEIAIKEGRPYVNIKGNNVTEKVTVLHHRVVKLLRSFAQLLTLASPDGKSDYYNPVVASNQQTIHSAYSASVISKTNESIDGADKEIKKSKESKKHKESKPQLETAAQKMAAFKKLLNCLPRSWIPKDLEATYKHLLKE